MMFFFFLFGGGDGKRMTCTCWVVGLFVCLFVWVFVCLFVWVFFFVFFLFPVWFGFASGLVSSPNTSHFTSTNHGGQLLASSTHIDFFIFAMIFEPSLSRMGRRTFQDRPIDISGIPSRERSHIPYQGSFESMIFRTSRERWDMVLVSCRVVPSSCKSMIKFEWMVVEIKDSSKRYSILSNTLDWDSP